MVPKQGSYSMPLVISWLLVIISDFPNHWVFDLKKIKRKKKIIESEKKKYEERKVKKERKKGKVRK